MAKPAAAPAPAAPPPAPPAAPAAAPATPALTAEAARMASPFAIEDNVPIPEKRIGVKGESVYPFDKLGVGQSFFVPANDRVKEPWKTLTSMASRMTREFWPRKFVTARTVNDPAKGTVDGVRIWRTQDGTGAVPESKPRPRKAKEGETAEAAPASNGAAPNFDAAPATA